MVTIKTDKLKQQLNDIKVKIVQGFNDIRAKITGKQSKTAARPGQVQTPGVQKPKQDFQQQLDEVIRKIQLMPMDKKAAWGSISLGTIFILIGLILLIL